MRLSTLLITLNSDFDWDKVIVDEPKTNTFTKGSATTEWTTSNVYVLGENDSKLPIYFELAEHKLWEVNGIWRFGTPKEGQSNDKLEGFQFYYPLTSTKTVGKPTKAEKATRHVFDMMNNITIDALKKFSKARKVPAPTYSSYKFAKEENDWTYAVKPLYTHTKKQQIRQL